MLDRLVCVGATPTLLDLLSMKGADGEPLRVIETIAAGNYKKFGMYLLQDKNGTMVDLLKKNHIHDGVENVTQAILQKWLTSDAPTRTYQHLIECLGQSELGALAELIEIKTVGQGMLPIKFKLQSQTRHRRCLCLGGMLCIHACLTKYAELKYTSSNESLLLLVEHYVSG